MSDIRTSGVSSGEAAIQQGEKLLGAIPSSSGNAKPQRCKFKNGGVQRNAARPCPKKASRKVRMLAFTQQALTEMIHPAALERRKKENLR